MTWYGIYYVKVYTVGISVSVYTVILQVNIDRHIINKNIYDKGIVI